MQGEGKIFHRDREVEFRAVTLRLGQQLTRRFSLELDVSNQLRNINVFRRQAGAQYVIRVGHHLQRHPLQIGVRRFSKQEHRFAWVQLHHVQQQRGEEAAVVRIEFRDQADCLPRFALFTGQYVAQHLQRLGLFLTLHI